MNKRGHFIVFEGVDNSGKTTVSTAIKQWLEDQFRITSILTKHPGSTPIGFEIRKILKHNPEPINSNAQALLFAADNSIFINDLLKPTLNTGSWVIADRNNFISSLAYQISSGCGFDELDKVHDSVRSSTKIDLLLIFKCDLETSLKRKDPNEGFDRYEDAGKEYLAKLINCYDNLVDTQPHRLNKFVKSANNIYYIDATQELPDVIDQVKLILSSYISQYC